MLYFIVRNGSPIVGGFGVNRWLRRGIYRDRLCLRSNRELYIDCVRLFWNQLQLQKILLLEPVLRYNQVKLVGRQRIEVINAAGIAGTDLLFAGAVVCEGQGGAGNYRDGYRCWSCYGEGVTFDDPVVPRDTEAQMSADLAFTDLSEGL